jgi:protein-L-isoaspartate(D-aspartate) O-methyltransferase
MVAKLEAAGVGHPAVLAAFLAVPRHVFVDSALVTQAYEDTSLPIGYGQTISKPSVVGRMVQLLMEGVNARRSDQQGAPSPLGRVLEIGTGCGYQAAVLACISKSVISIERLKPLHDKARELLNELRTRNLRLIYGDGMLGHAPNAPYDSIIAAAGGEALPEAWLNQLAVGGRLVAPVALSHQVGMSRQALTVVDRTADGLQRHVLEDVLFVPLKSGLI